MKIKCKKCNEYKDEVDFYEEKRSLTGRSSSCKVCTRLAVKKNLELVGDSYDSSEKGVIRVIYKTQKRNNKNRGHGDMPYTKKELSKWLYENGFKKIYDKWIDSGKCKGLKPSVDRLNDFFGYSFDNIRLVTWSENKAHQSDDFANGTGTSGRVCKKVIKMDDEMVPVCEYVSYWSAVRDVGYSIEYQIKKGVKCRSGFFWKYA